MPARWQAALFATAEEGAQGIQWPLPVHLPKGFRRIPLPAAQALDLGAARLSQRLSAPLKTGDLLRQLGRATASLCEARDCRLEALLFSRLARVRCL